MPHSKITFSEAAQFLHLHSEELKYFVARGRVPFFKEKGKILFRKNEIKEWATQQLFEMTTQKRNIKKPVSPLSKIWKQNDNDYESKKLSDYISIKSLEPHLNARTKPSLLKELVHLALETCLLSNADLLLQLLQERENLSPTGLENGIAIPHPKIHIPDLFFDSFLVIAKVQRGIPFGSLDGKMCDLFFMPCAEDDKTHIFMLTRIATLLKKTKLSEDLRENSSKEEMLQTIRTHEETFFYSL